MPALSADIRLIVGLGNPGADYANTRHNAGFWFVDLLAQQFSLLFRLDQRAKTEKTTIRTSGKNILLLKPQTFMNRSGQAVAAVTRYYGLQSHQLMLVHDELDLEPGDHRLKLGGGHGGHNGLRDTMQHLGARDFLRLRIGIGHPDESGQVINYVLQKPAMADFDMIQSANQRALKVMPLIFEGRLDKAMQALHTPDKDCGF